MEKNNLNIIIRKDGKQIVGYVEDLQTYFVREAQRMLDHCTTKTTENIYEDDEYQRLDKVIYAVKDLSSYVDRNALVKADCDERGYWCISFVY